MPQPLAFARPGGGQLSAVLDAGTDVFATVVLAHGAGAGMHHPFMAALAAALAANGAATLRFQFPFAEDGRKRVDPPAVAHEAWRAALAAAEQQFPGRPLFAAGKSFGGRMATQLQASRPWPGLRGLVLLGFPLHPAGQPATARADHLVQVDVPMLFLQGTRDALAELSLLRPVLQRLPLAQLHEIAGADHGFHVPARTGRRDADVIGELAQVATAWMRARLGGPAATMGSS